jgi:hypothetical protein
LSPEYEVEAVIGSEFVRGGTDNTWSALQSSRVVGAKSVKGRARSIYTNLFAVLNCDA